MKRTHRGHPIFIPSPRAHREELHMNTPFSRLKERFHQKYALLATLSVFLLFFLFSAIYFLCVGNLRNAALSLLFLVIELLIAPTEQRLRLYLPTFQYGLLLFLMLGSLLGSCYNFYFIIPFWDILLHGLSGVIFAFIGYAICTLLFPKREGSKISPYLFVGILFSLSIALLWEMFEAAITLTLAVDMQEDMLVHDIKSFFFSGTHNFVTVLEDITETVIHYGGGQTMTVSGYLDLGLFDTLGDMAICLGGNLVFLLLFPLDKLLRGRLLPHLLPEVKKST